MQTTLAPVNHGIRHVDDDAAGTRRGASAIAACGGHHVGFFACSTEPPPGNCWIYDLLDAHNTPPPVSFRHRTSSTCTAPSIPAETHGWTVMITGARCRRHHSSAHAVPAPHRQLADEPRPLQLKQRRTRRGSWIPSKRRGPVRQLHSALYGSRTCESCQSRAQNALLGSLSHHCVGKPAVVPPAVDSAANHRTRTACAMPQDARLIETIICLL
jgi:hypothetical protein